MRQKERLQFGSQVIGDQIGSQIEMKETARRTEYLAITTLQLLLLQRAAGE